MTQSVEAASVKYDEFVDPQLDMSLWSYLEYPLPDGSSWRCAEPHADMTISDGTLSLRVEKFERSHDEVQIMDNPKFLILSTESFPLPPDSVVTFSVRMSATSLGGDPHDFRDGVAAFNVLDMDTGFVFDIAANSDHVWAIHEMLPVPTAVAAPFTHMTENPFSGVQPSAGKVVLGQIAFDTAQSTVAWLVDEHAIASVRLEQMPTALRVGLGLFTLHPLDGAGSHSLRGQGMAATWSDVTVDVAAT